MKAWEAAPKSAVHGIAWPALPPPTGTAALALQYQLDQSQWWQTETLAEAGFQQLSLLLKYAFEAIPFYRQRLSAAGYQPGQPVTPEQFAYIPLLSKADVQQQGELLLSRQVPRDHGAITKGMTSGSTGRPVTYFGTDITGFFWHALTLRDHLWHNRDFSGNLAIIKAGLENKVLPGWGPSTDVAFETGASMLLDIRADIDAQIDWLQQQNPDYVLTHPSNAQALAETCLARGIRLKNLREVRTMGETVGTKLHETCRAAWNVPVADVYSAAEVGYMALQCPEHGHYHVQSESVLLEVLNDQDQPCVAGEIGRVVVTTLHNFAMPMIRYEILDYAEVGERCACGRGLPVLKRIMGRERNLVTFPDGKRHWPRIGYKHWQGILPIQQSQLVQRSLHEIEAKLVTSRPLLPNEEAQLTSILHTSLGYPFQIVFSYHNNIPRSSGGKFEDFLSEIGKAGNV